MVTDKVILTYKRKRLSSRLDHGTCCPQTLKEPKVSGCSKLDDSKTDNVECPVEDSLTNKKQDSIIEICSCTKPCPGDDLNNLKEDPRLGLPDLNLTDSPVPVHSDLFFDTKPILSIPDGHASSHMNPGLPDACHMSHPEAKEIHKPPEVNAGVVRLEALRKGTSDAPLITFVRRAKMKKCVSDLHIKDAVPAMDMKIVGDTAEKYELRSNMNGIFYRRREKSSHVSKKDEVADTKEDNLLQHLREMPQTENAMTVDASLESSAAPCMENSCIDIQISQHSVLEDCNKEKCPDKLELTCLLTTLPNSVGFDEVNKRKQDDDANSMKENSFLASSANTKNCLMNLELPVATSSLQNLQLMPNIDDRGKSLQWLNQWATSQLSERDGVGFSSANEVDIGNNQDRRSRSSNAAHAKLIRHNLYELVHGENVFNSLQFQERVFLSNFPSGRHDTQHCHGERSPVFTNFLGPSDSHSDPASSSLTNLVSLGRPFGPSIKDNSSYGSQILFGNPPLTSKTHVDNNLFGTKMPTRRQGVSPGFRRHLTIWSEEELDSLWIGVRRHGRNNWYVMLRDPRLYFQEGRTTKDLAERWDLEQLRLFNSVQFPSINLKSADSMVENLSVEFQKSRTETQLSLGNGYFRKSENFMNRNVIQLPDMRASCLTVGSTSYAADDYSKKTFWKANARNQKQNHPRRPSVLERNTAGRATSLPHWLKEVVGAPLPRPSQTSFPLSIDSKRGILKRSNACSAPKFSELSLGSEASAVKNQFDLNKTSPEQRQRNDLVMTECDASSEETISDDGRV